MIPFLSIGSLVKIVIGAALILAGAMVMGSGYLGGIESGVPWLDLVSPQLPEFPSIGAVV